MSGAIRNSSHQKPPGGIASGRPRTARPEGSPPLWLSSVQAAKAISPSGPVVVAPARLNRWLPVEVLNWVTTDRTLS
jgi:hypothetical protein